MTVPVIIGDATLYCADCMEILPTLGKVDAVVTDPPYGLGESNRKKHMSRGQLADPVDYGDYDWDERPCSPEQITAMRICSRHQIIFGGNYFNLPPTPCWLVWDKLNGENDFADCELAWTNLDKAVRRIRWLWNGMIRRGHEERYHPTQKPLGVIEWCINHLPPETLTILDPFMGSGTTGVACAKLGRKFIGVEIEERYFSIACRRIEEAYRQPRLFADVPAKAVQAALL